MSLYNILTDKIEEAAYWIAEEDGRREREFLRDRVTPGKKYKLVLLKEKMIGINGEKIVDEDYFIKDDQGQWGMHYMVHKGYFIK